MNPKRDYVKRKEKYKKELDKLNHKINLYGNIRLIIILVGLGITIWTYTKKSYLLSLNSLIITLVLFISLVMIHQKYIEKRPRLKALIKINENGLKRLKGEWKKFIEAGEEFIDETHNYSWDLDIFGKSSLFQWTNHTNTPIGKKKLRDAYIRPNKNIDQIKERQEAIKELATKMNWVHEFQAAGMRDSNKSKDEGNLIRWSKDVISIYLNNLLNLFVKILPVVSIGSIIMPFIIPSFSWVYAAVFVSIQVIVVFKDFGKRNNRLSSIDDYRKQVQIYEKMIEVIENQEFDSALLVKLQQQMQTGNEVTSKQIKKLDSIMDMINVRHIQFYLIFDILTLWDYQCTISLESWKNKYGKNMVKWLDALGELEALASLSTIVYEQPEWVMPEVVDDYKIYATALGHPLINANQRVCNSVSFGGRYASLLITGSNMSGKSTFLRTIGINLVLAYAGAPVCAEEFICPIMNIYTSMRVKDDIDNKISSFYAELLRIKKIIEATDKGEKVFYLLDEIFKGTNSRDRHIGAKTLIKKLCKGSTLGLVSTHDLELADLEKEQDSKVKNYHFQEFYKNDKINFDYKLYKGVSNTFNAVYLMKEIGIEI
ncbi:DNA mismatch repair protein [Vallitalea longa]|uniref:DNA mismatch repair protein n=1 Tax=Vallitalea longa TaxID=2936439 RepID=A0A9W5YA79_9FIRM|nr:MutS family DNA mismatch repair protein [Vallitalea longa]GKX29757.1 DNA mismatch repair protein [Vallitalea longa]